MILRGVVIVGVAVHFVFGNHSVFFVVNKTSLSLLLLLLLQLLVVKRVVIGLKLVFNCLAVLASIVHNAVAVLSNICLGHFTSFIVYLPLVFNSLFLRKTKSFLVASFSFSAFLSLVSEVRVFVCDLDLLVKSVLLVHQFADTILDHLLLKKLVSNLCLPQSIAVSSKASAGTFHCRQGWWCGLREMGRPFCRVLGFQIQRSGTSIAFE